MRTTTPMTFLLGRPLVLAFLLLSLIPLTVLCSEPSKDPKLRLETGTHTAQITRISVDRENRFLVTGSIDKTVRVWELPSLRLIRTLRPPIGEGNEGNIDAVAISPDGRTIAAAGWTGWEWDKKASIYLFDRESGRMTRPKGLQGLPLLVGHLAYSKEGRFLVATLKGPNGIRIYRTSDYTLVREDSKYGGDSYGADFDLDGRLVTASDDGFIRLYDKDFTLPPKKTPQPNGRPSSVSFSSDGTKVAVGFDVAPMVDVLSGKDLSYLYSPDTSGVDGGLSAVSWSSDDTLYAGGSYIRGAIAPILKWAEAGKGPRGDLPAAGNTIMQILSLRDDGVAFGGGGPAFGIFDRTGTRTHFRGPEIADFRGDPEGLLVSRAGAAVQFGFELWGKSTARFSLTDRLLTLDPLPPPTLTAPVTSAEGLAFERSDWFYTSEPKLNKNPLKLAQHERSQSLAICPDRQCFLLGADWTLRLFDSKGTEKWHEPIETPGVAWSVNTAGDGRVAVAAFGDGTVRWYRLKDGEELLAFFPAADKKRWVVWTPSGYYDASPGGEDLIGWHVNNGPDQAADFFPLSRFRSTYYRPDVIREVLNTLDDKEAVKLANNKAGITVGVKPVQETRPPVVEIISLEDNGQVGTKTLTIRYRVRSPGGETITGIRVFVDGGLFKEELGLNLTGADIVRPIEVSVPERDCEIDIIAQNVHNWGAAAKRQIAWTGSKKRANGVLYVVAIGVSEYQDDGLKKGVKRAAKDALDFADYMKGQTHGSLYRDVQVMVFSDGQAIKDNIIIALSDIAELATRDDLIMFFLSGHGEKDKFGKYRYLLADVDERRLPSRCLSHSDIRDPLAGFPGRRVVFIDTCRSGTMIDVIGFANELAGSENGRIVVFTSATGIQSSIEPPGESNGAFTKVLLEGLSGKAAGENKIVTISRLRVHLEEKVPILTNNAQKPDFVDLGGGAMDLAEVID